MVYRRLTIEMFTDGLADPLSVVYHFTNLLCAVVLAERPAELNGQDARWHPFQSGPIFARVQEGNR